MAGTTELLRQQAIARQEAIEGIGRLLRGEQSPRLMSALHDVAGRSDSVYVLSLCVAELVRVVEDQAAENAELRERVASLELEASAPKPKKSTQK